METLPNSIDTLRNSTDIHPLNEREGTADLRRANAIGDKIENSIKRSNGPMTREQLNESVDETVSKLLVVSGRAYNNGKLSKDEYALYVKGAIEKLDDQLNDADPSTSAENISEQLNNVPDDILGEGLKMMNSAKPVAHTKNIIHAIDKYNPHRPL